MKRMHVIIRGKVQGVFYRAGMQQTATALGFTGWVRNLPDGSVEALLEGDEQHWTAMNAWFWQGPPRAQVQDVELFEEPYKGEFSDFNIRH